MGQCLASESERRQIRRLQRAKTLHLKGSTKPSAVHPSPGGKKRKVKKDGTDGSDGDGDDGGDDHNEAENEAVALAALTASKRSKGKGKGKKKEGEGDNSGEDIESIPIVDPPKVSPRLMNHLHDDHTLSPSPRSPRRVNPNMGFQRSATMLPSAAMKLSPRLNPNGNPSNSPRKFNIHVEGEASEAEKGKDSHRGDKDTAEEDKNEVKRRASLTPQGAHRIAHPNMNIPIIRTVSLNPSSSSTASSLSARTHPQTSANTSSPRVPSTSRQGNELLGQLTPSKSREIKDKDGLALSSGSTPRMETQLAVQQLGRVHSTSRNKADRQLSGGLLEERDSLGTASVRKPNKDGAPSPRRSQPQTPPRVSPRRDVPPPNPSSEKKKKKKAKKRESDEDDDESSHSSQYLEKARPTHNEDD